LRLCTGARVGAEPQAATPSGRANESPTGVFFFIAGNEFRPSPRAGKKLGAHAGQTVDSPRRVMIR
jgi:hypothetical protein